MASIEPFQKLYTIQKVYTIQKLYTIQDKIMRAFQKCHFFLKLSDNQKLWPFIQVRLWPILVNFYLTSH